MKKYFIIPLLTFYCIIFAMDAPNQKENSSQISQIITQFDQAKKQLAKLKKEYEQEKKDLEKKEREQQDPMDPKNELETLEPSQLLSKLELKFDLENQRAALEETKSAILEIEQSIKTLDEVTTDIWSLVDDNDETPKIDSIEDHVISRGVLELRKADKYNRKNKQCLLQ